MTDKTISVLKERRGGERRVILLPDALRSFIDAGFRVLVEADAGASAGFDDAAYRAAGAEIVGRDEAWSRSRLVLKYKAPGQDEWRYFRRDLHLASFMHAEGNLEMTEAMRASGMCSYALEFFRTERGEFPVPVSDNEISGHLAILLAAYHLQTAQGGRGVLLSRVPGAPPAKVVVIGYGNVGAAAARLAAALGAEVTVFGTRHEGLRRIAALMPPNVRCEVNDPERFEQSVLEADLVVGAILISTYDTPPMLPESLVRRMKPGAAIVDVTCGYGAGYMPTFDRFTHHETPFFERFGVLHCKIDAMPASVPLTAAAATSANVAPYLLQLAQAVYGGKPDPVSAAGIVAKDYAFVHPEVVRHAAFAEQQRLRG
jgi:alanine dehydrogenase